MERISWFRRLFWSWEQLKSYWKDNFETENQGHLIESRKRNDDLSKHNDTLKEQIQDYKQQLKKYEIEKARIEEAQRQTHEHLDLEKNKNQNLKQQIDEVKVKIEEKQKENETLRNDINDKLMPISKIEKTFFGKNAVKGVGELGELQVKRILEKSGLPNEFWTENLKVGTNNVEFAIKAGEKEKWIPVDSKVISPDLDDDNKAIIDDQYFKRIKIQAKEMVKYLSKHNTAGYGVLVLQSDSIYIKVYELNPNLFEDITTSYKIYIASPASFVQMAWSISQIVGIYEQVENDEKIYKDMISALESIAKFANALQDARRRLNIAMNAHFPAIENKHQNLRKKLDKNNKLKEIKKLDVNSSS